MNIVILTIILPYPLDSGGAQAQYNMIDNLRCKHNITVIFPENGSNSMSAMRELQRRWPEVNFKPYRYLFQLMDMNFLYSKAKRAFKKFFMRNNPRFQVEWMLTPYGYPVNNRFAHFVNGVLKETNVDLIQIEFYPYLNFVHKITEKVRKIFVHHEIRYIRNERLLANVNLLPKDVEYMNFLRKQELEDLNSFDAVITLTDVDAAELKSNGVTVPVVVSPASVNAVSKEYTGWNGKITFLGGCGHTPNKEGVEWFLDKVVPLVKWDSFSGVSLQIIGGGWGRDIEHRSLFLNVKCMGFVENLYAVAKGSIMIVPILSGSGMRMKILEAAAMGVPIITTSVGVEGLLFEDGKSCLIADSPQEFSGALEKVMKSDDLRMKLTRNARELYEKMYSPKATSIVRDNLYNIL